ncbi:MAG: glycosyltransferase family 39 protein [Alphaproteobacteria bacterium]|nr:glycosyltransferase family 39 protein [Alphaproteobacteria bacterium]
MLLKAFDSTADACARLAMSPRAVAAIWAAVYLSVWLMRTFLFVGGGADESEQLVHTQSWQWGYGPINPPLVTWLMTAALALFGVNLGTVVAMKFGLLALTCMGIYLVALRLLKDKGLAALTALSPIAIYYFAWDALFHYSHSVILALSVTFTFLVFLQIAAHRRTRDYLLFGVVLGLGLLSKYSYGLFALALLVGAIADRDLRGCILDRRLAVSVLIAILIVTPHFLWLAENAGWFTAQATARFTGGTQMDSTTSIRMGVYNVAKATISFPLPLVAFLAILFPRACWRDGNRFQSARSETRLLERGFLIILAMMFLGVILFNASHVRIHYMFLMILLPVYFFARIQAAVPAKRALGILSGVLIFLAFLIPTAVAIKYVVDPARGSKARYNMPYAVFADQLKAAGFKKGTIIGDWLTYPVAGNLRPYFPDSRAVSLLSWDLLAAKRDPEKPLLAPRATHADGQCLIVWTPQKNGKRRRSVIRFSAGLLGVKLPNDTPGREIRAEMPPHSGRIARLGYILIPGGSGHCR